MNEVSFPLKLINTKNEIHGKESLTKTLFDFYAIEDVTTYFEKFFHQKTIFKLQMLRYF